MDETRIRAIVREEIRLAMRSLADAMDTRDPDSEVSFELGVSCFESYAYRGACEEADSQRKVSAENPFTETGPDASVDKDVKLYVHSAVQGVLRDLRDSFYMSGWESDTRLADRLEDLIRTRENVLDE